MAGEAGAGATVAVARLEELAPGELRQVEVGERAVLLARVGDEVFATGAFCTHYGAPLAEGVLHGRRVICPWHHAVYDVATGGHLEPPGCDQLERYEVTVENGAISVRLPAEARGTTEPPAASPAPERDARTLAIVGAGAAGQAAAEALRANGYEGRVVLIGGEHRPPYDRTVLSKEAMQGAELAAPFLLRPAEFYERRGIELRLGRPVTRIDAGRREITFEGGEVLAYDACLVATGGAPRRLEAPGADLEGVVTLRDPDDGERIVAAAREGAEIVVVGSSFIGLECAASLAMRGVHVTVVTPEAIPFAKLLGEEVGRALVRLHEEKGVTFLTERKVERFEGEGSVQAAITDRGERLRAELVVIGMGIRPNTNIVEGVERAEDGGIGVDRSLRAADGLYAAGDIARFPLPRTGEPVRVEHWRLACEHGRVAALNMLGREVAYEGVPFFWSAQHIALYYVGHAASFDEAIIDGAPGDGPFIAYYVVDGAVAAALGVERNAEMAAIQELMRVGRMPEADRVRAGGFDAVAELRLT